MERGNVGKHGAFGALLRKFRAEANITQEELAERSGLSPKAIAALEQGTRRSPRPSTVEWLAEALKLDVSRKEAFVAAARGLPDHHSSTHSNAWPGVNDSNDLLRSVPTDVLVVHETGPTTPHGSPGIELVALERRIRASLNGGGPADIPPPSQMPRAIADFKGRQAETRDLCVWLSREDGGPVAIVTGPGGAGKTALALEVARRLRPAFPDGQLYVDLEGVGERPLRPATALARLLRGMGLDGAAIPLGLADRAAAYRSRLTGRRVLVMLDNAAGETQVRPLLPGGDGPATIVTSRSVMSGLESAHAVTLGMLGPAEARDLLSAVVGAQRVAAEPDAAAAIVDGCGRLPLAVRIAGARVARRHGQSLAAFAARLADERRRLDELRAGDLAVRASLAASYRALDAGARTAFRLLSVCDVPDFAPWLAAAMLDVDRTAAEDLLEQLADAHLLEPGEGRYRFHELVRLLARELLEAEDEPATRLAALHRAMGAALTLAAGAHAAISPGNAAHVVRGSAPRWPADDGVGRDPIEWFESERAVLVAVVEQACREGPPDLAWELAGTITTFCGIRGHWQDWRSTQEQAVERARRDGSVEGEAQAEELLGVYHLWLSEWDAALPHFVRTLALARRTGSRRLEAAALYGTGVLAGRAGDMTGARDQLGQALAHYRAVGDGHGQACVLLGLGIAELAAGQIRDAHAAMTEALAGFSEQGERDWFPITLLSLSDCHRAAGRSDEAGACLTRCLAIFDALGSRSFAARARYRLASLKAAAGNLAEAESLLTRCAEVSAQLGLAEAEARAHRKLAAVRASAAAASG
jgi:transcriptional regulator with XRE-family HTH domain/tetratricopeptide (TPR) repeat protein